MKIGKKKTKRKQKQYGRQTKLGKSVNSNTRAGLLRRA